MANKVYLDNEEATEAWNGVLFDRFVEYRDILTTGLGAHGDEAMRGTPPRLGDRVLDIGCGFGDTTQQLAALVGRRGHVVGIDVSDPFIEAAQEESDQAGIENVSFIADDVQVAVPNGPFDYAFARFGTMFFANPVVAMRNVRMSLTPGGQLCMVVWRRKLDNEWMHSAEQVVAQWLETPDPDDSDEPTCGPGPFSMANADTTSGILQSAGFEQISLRRCDIEISVGSDLDRAVSFAMALGPAGEVIRLSGEAGDQLRPQIASALREAFAEYDRPEGIVAPASTWIVTATAPLMA